MSRWTKCPKCNNVDFNRGEVMFDEHDMWRENKCSCGMNWYEVWEFSHNEDEDMLILDDNGDVNDGQ